MVEIYITDGFVYERFSRFGLSATRGGNERQWLLSGVQIEPIPISRIISDYIKIFKKETGWTEKIGFIRLSPLACMLLFLEGKITPLQITNALREDILVFESLVLQTNEGPQPFRVIVDPEECRLVTVFDSLTYISRYK